VVAANRLKGIRRAFCHGVFKGPEKRRDAALLQVSPGKAGVNHRAR
jgi:hypothetical protein